MTETSKRIGSAGLPPSPLLSANTFNPLIGATADHPISIPPGTPVIVSGAEDATVIPARANQAPVVSTATVVGLAAIPGVVGNHGLIQMGGPLTLSADQWDVVTGGSGGLARGSIYYLSAAAPSGRLTTVAPTVLGTFTVQVGIALSETELMIQLGIPKAN